MEDGRDDASGTRWDRTCLGGGVVRTRQAALCLALPDGARDSAYSDAQIDDYAAHGRHARLRWRPPVRMRVRARASGSFAVAGGTAATDDLRPRDTATPASGLLHGTLGFGFWNYPLSLRGAVLRPPDAVWFFGASPPSAMALVPGSPGWGWKAQVVHAHRPAFMLAALPTLGAVAWARASGREGTAARWVQRLSGAHEAILAADLRLWHEYTLDWHAASARFAVDGDTVLVVPEPPRGPLGFVAWMDNQYAIATPHGTLAFGTLACGPQWLDLDRLVIEPL